MMLQPCTRVDEQGEARCVTLRKAVLAEALDLRKDGFGKLAIVAALEHPVHNAVVVGVESTLAAPCGHRAPQLVGLAGGESGREHRDLHHLLLKDRHAERARERLFHLRTWIGHWLQSLPPAQVGMHHAALHRARTDDRHLDHEIVKAARLQAGQHAHLRARLDLEHANGIGATDHLVGLGIFGRNVLQLKRLAALF
ncbi:hypothetical protein R69658_08057 [Paraburkholderia aspalathi]|uniref:Uncharacterized protein n=1 Tax=Paraburkholderia aspalathi TaxID=1324617 RepID=A0ABM8T9M7_9BURK|nr:hypothetical protein R69658_08057 [Paraburkholderia aspalathi]